MLGENISLEIPKYCDICQKGPFSSAQNAHAHFQSSSHKETESRAKLNSLPSSINQFFCKVCSEQCNGPKSFMEHMASPRHKVKSDKFQNFQTKADPIDIQNKPYDFDGRRGYCHICKVDLTSPENASQHLNGDKHRKKMQQIENQLNTNCNACNLNFSDEDSLDMHFKKFHQPFRMETREFSSGGWQSPPSSLPQQGQQQDELDKKFHDCLTDIENELPPQSVLDNMERRSTKSSQQGKYDKDEQNAEYSFNITTGFCNVCQVQLTSIQNRDQHLSGAKHKKAKAAWQAKRGDMSSSQMDRRQQNTESCFSGQALLEELEYIFEGESGFCNVCKMELRSLEHASDHLNSNIHKNAKEDWMKKDISLSKSSFTDDVAPVSIPPHSFTQSSQKTQNLMSEKPRAAKASPAPQQSSEKPEYSFVGKRGYCNVCNLELTSEQHKNQHLSGAKHQKAKNAAAVKVMSQPAPAPGQSKGQEYTFNGSRGFCHVCNLELTSRQHADQHLAGAKHQKNKNVEITNVPVIPAPPVKNQTHGSNEVEFTFSGSRGRCNVCKIELTSKAHADNHLNGKPHAKAKQRWLQGITETGALFCEICQISCSGPESMQQHLVSKKHKDRELLAGNRGQLGETPVTIPVISSDNTKWFVCEVCNCKLNSQQQLDAHKKSPKHKAQEEKFNRQGGIWSETRQSASTIQTGQQFDHGYGNSQNDYRYRHVQETVTYQQGQRSMYAENNTWNSRLVNSQVYQASMSPADLGNPMPSFVKPLPSVIKPETPHSTNTDLPIPTGLPPNHSSNPAFQPVLSPVNSLSESVDHLTSLQSFNYSLGSTLALGSLCDNNSVLKTDIKSMLAMNRPKVFQSDSIENEIEVQIGVNSYRNLDYDQTHLKGLSSMDDTALTQSTTDVNSSAMSPEKEDTYKSLVFKSADEEISCKLQYHRRGFPDGGDSDEDVSNCSKISIAESSKTSSGSNETVPQGSQPVERDIIIPKKTVDVLPMFGDSHFTVSDPAELTSSGSSSNSVSKKTYGSDEAHAIKNRSKSKPLQTSLSSQDSSLENQSSGTNDSVFQEDKIPSGSDGDSNLTDKQSLEIEMPQNLTAHVFDNSGKNPDRNSPYRFYCSTCNTPINSEKAYKDHVRGQRHLNKVATEPAPDRQHPSSVMSVNDYGRISFNLTKTTPRSYQIELFSKTMENDRVCFLPTGTGKTLISCMAISAMLEQNPTRQVMFLVDKVLLVLQQSQYIKKEIGDRKYKRFSHTNPSEIEERGPLIAALCGGLQKTGGIPLWKHDVIVVTAAFYENLLMKKILRWDDTSLVVFDEAHHCVKNHPFNKLLQGYHRKCPEKQRPKLLGLTASPAGLTTVQDTVVMLRHLMGNLGGAMVALVEDNTYELKKYQSSAKIDVQYTAMTPKEKSFKDELQIYLIRCYMRLGEETDLLQQFDLGLTSKTKQLSEQDLQKFAKEVDGSLLNSLEVTVNMAHPKESATSDKKIFSRNLIKHTQYICIVLNVLMESGVNMAVEELQELMALDPATSFEFAETHGLPCGSVRNALETCMNVEGPYMSLQSPGSDSSPQLSKLVEIVTRPDYVNWSNKRAMVLVLVKQRETAFKMKGMLQSHDSIKKLQLNVEAVVGHGSTSGTEVGMSVPKQKQILDNMKKNVYQIVVATSVAEEGIDIPECELVVTFNPPSTVTALVQMRGRARKDQSKFVILCNNSKEKDELEDLMMKEENMIKAAETIVKEQKSRKQ